MRGTGNPNGEKRLVKGITPAHAGNRTIQQLKLDTIKDHPRTCGEQISFMPELQATRGSPPHMRGTVIPVNGDGERLRITPAHAGNSRLIRLLAW